MNDLASIIGEIAPVEQSWMEKSRERQNRLTKPPQSLGRLEEIACRLAAVQQTLRPSVDRKRIVIFAGDHGVTEEGVSPYPAEVTAQMVANFLNGGAAINALARTAGAELVVVDAGVKAPIPSIDISGKAVRLVQKPVRPGTRNFTRGAAMTREEVLAAIALGHEMALDAKRAGINLLGAGEMGIGNTTSAAAIASALTGLPAAAVTGRGTGADDEILAKKRQVVDQAVRLHGNTSGALEILQALGGLELAGMVGLYLGAAASRIAVICDGFIASASAAVAVRLCPACSGYLFAGHLSTEPGHIALLNIIQQEPLLNLNMRLGEGTGAALAMNIADAALRAFVEMATFESAGVSDKQELAQEVDR